MLYYILFWTLLGFIIHFYIIFGTNLLTGGPTQNCCFLPILGFRRKGILNGVQTEWNLWERDFWNEQDPGDLDPTSSNQKGGHEVGARLPTPGAPTTLMGTLLLHRCTPSSYVYLRTPKWSDTEPKNPNSTATTFCILEIPSWGLFWSSAGGGIDHRGLLHHHPSPSDEVWVVYFRPTGP